jgi:hypothetical protein
VAPPVFALPRKSSATRSYFREGAVSGVPSTITHAMTNFQQVARLDDDYPGKTWVRTALCALTAYLLFRLSAVEVA